MELNRIFRITKTKHTRLICQQISNWYLGRNSLEQKLYLCTTEIKTPMDFAAFFNNCPHCSSDKFVVNNEKSKKCQSCGFTFYMNASAAVAAFITNSEGKLLVCKRAKEPAKGTYDLPGGFIDNNETAEEAVKRELKEELGAEATQVKYLFSLPNNYLYSGLTIPTLDLFFECELKTYENLIAADDVAGFEFIPKKELNPNDFGLNSIKKAIDIFKSSKQ